MFRFLRSAQLLVLLALLFTAGLAAQQTPPTESPPPDESTSSDPAAQQEPLDLGVIEEVEVSLMYLDVEVRDKAGNPVPGLAREDFELRLNARDWPIYSVDDLCACDDARLAGAGNQAGGVVAPAPSGAPPDGSSGPATAAVGAFPLQARQIIFYFDFSQLQVAGRGHALNVARRWVRESMMPGDRVMLMAFAVRTGLHEICPFTDSATVLLSSLDAAEENPELIDSFPSQFEARIHECLDCLEICRRASRGGFGPCPLLPCIECCIECRANPMQEFYHGRRSLNALRLFMEFLQIIPGPKSVFLLHQNNVLFPGRFYPIPEPDFTIGTHYKLLESVGTEAVEARATVHPLHTALPNSGLMGQATNLGANLADFTGGQYNRDPADLLAVMNEGVTACRCTYRIAFEPRGVSASRLYKATVTVRGSALPYRYRVRYLSSEERLARKVRGVLGNPSLADDLLVSASLVPLSAVGRRWQVAVQVALDLGHLRLLRLTDDEVGALDVGVLLYEEGGRPNWEMLAGSRVRRPAGQEVNQSILHQKALDGLGPGRYRLVAFARNQELDLYGGAEATLELPSARKGGVVGPIVLCADREFFLSALPLFNETLPEEQAITKVSKGSVPAAADAVRRGEPLEMVTWLCPSANSRAGVSGLASGQGVTRHVSRDGKPLARLPDPVMETSGRCVRLVDRVETDTLAPGRYTYHLSWLETEGREPRETTAEFSVVEPPGGQTRAAAP